MGELMSCNCLYFILIEFIYYSSRKNDSRIFGISTGGKSIEAIVIQNPNVGSRQTSGDTQILYYIIDLRIFNPCDRSRTSKFENDLSIEVERNYSSDENDRS